MIEGVAYVSEAAITGESAPVLKEPGTDIASSVTGGTQVISDWLMVRITAEPGKTFLDRMIALVEGAARQKTPNEIALNILLAGLTIIFLIVVVTLRPALASTPSRRPRSTVLIALLVTLIPTTIGALLSAIGIAGMDRLVQRNVLAMSGRAVEAAGDIDVLLLDKTGTITYGNRMAAEFIPVAGVSAETSWRRRRCAPRWPTRRRRASRSSRWPSSLGSAADRAALDGAEFIPFTAETRMSGIRLNGHATMKGAVDAVARLARRAAGRTSRRRPTGSRAAGRHAAGGDRGRPAARRHLPQGHRQAGHARALRRAAGDGHPHDHDHRRQPADRADDRRPRRASTTSSPRPSRRTRSGSSASSRPRAAWWR